MQNSKQFKKFLKNIKTEFSFLKNQPLLIACSGGVDSMAMLHLFYNLQQYFPLTLKVCSVNHKLRENAQKEVEFVKKECEKLKLDFYPLEFADNFWQSGKENLEERARNERYNLIFTLAKQQQIQYLATAHHKDDLVETLMMRIFERGTGLEGLKGILPISKNKEMTLIRPLLDFEKSEIKDLMSKKQFIEDESNQDTTFTRNKFRHKILPEIEKIFGKNFKNNLSRLSKASNNEMIYSNELSEIFWKNQQTEKGYLITRKEIESHSIEFWTTALSKLFQKHRKFSHSQKALKDIVAFLFKREPKTANYHPFIFQRTKDFVKIFFNKNSE